VPGPAYPPLVKLQNEGGWLSGQVVNMKWKSDYSATPPWSVAPVVMVPL